MTTIAISTTTGEDGEYAHAVSAAGGAPRLLDFDLERLDAQLAGAQGVLLSGGGDIDPRHYGVATDLATEIDARRDAFEVALVRHARRRGLPTLCICRGLQVANVAFGGTLVPDIAATYGAATAALHRVEVDGASLRGIIPEHDVALESGSLLAAIVAAPQIATGSRHHQSIATVASDLMVVGRTSDGIIEALEARFAAPFWLAVQWHPESTLSGDGGASQAIFAAFITAAGRFG